MTSLFRRIVPVRVGETGPVFLATAYGFAILFAHYILRPVRDEISAADRGNLQLLWTAVFLVMLVAVPLYSALVARYSRATFIPVANRFFAFNLLLFFGALTVLPEGARPWIDRVFYVWQSVFALFVVTVFWGFIADLFRNEQSKRLFGFIAVGSSLGAIAGSGLTAMLAGALPVFALLLLAIVPLEAAAWIARALHGQAETRTTLNREGGALIGGSILAGFTTVFRSPYLRTIAGFLALMTFASTILYFEQAFLLGEEFVDRGRRTEILAQMDLAVNVITIGTQGFLAAHIIRILGLGLTLAIVPAIAFVGFVSLGVYPLLAVLIVVQVLYRAFRYALAKPAREVLFTVVGREERYKAKAFIDAAVYRGGDLVSGWTYAGLAAAGLTVGAISLVAAPFALVWALFGLSLGRREQAMREDEEGTTPPDPVRVVA